MITFASCITLIRIFLTPFVVYYIHLQAWTIAALFFVIAASTDLIDGFVARRFNQQSSLGQLLDPIADKCLIMSTLYALLMIVAASFWQKIAVWFLLAKEIILLGGGAWLKLRYDFFIAPSRLSRAASLAEIFLILFLFMSLIFFGNVSTFVFSVLLSINLFVSAWLLIRYALVINNKFC
jgi:cardiolipin synthase